MKLYDIAEVIRSKNAGPFTLTLDLIFKNNQDFEKVLNSQSLNSVNIAKIYKVKSSKIGSSQKSVPKD